jgi:type II secretory pathway component PulJ
MEMELVISIVLGAWISVGGWLAYRSLEKEYHREGGKE